MWWHKGERWWLNCGYCGSVEEVLAQKIDVLAHLGCGGLLGKRGGLELVAHLRCGDSK